MSGHDSLSFAPGGPGIEPRWTRGAKVATGTAYSTSSHVWYTLNSCETGLSESGFSRVFTLPGRSGISYQSTEGKREFLVESSGGTT